MILSFCLNTLGAHTSDMKNLEKGHSAHDLGEMLFCMLLCLCFLTYILLAIFIFGLKGN